MQKLTSKKLLNTLIKTIIGGLLIWAIYRQVFARQDASVLWQGLVDQFVHPNLYWLVVVLLMVPVNISLEAMKWKVLIRQFLNIKFVKVVKAVLSGITIAIFTPNRVGEYGGRILFVPAEHNWKAVIATLVGSLAQLLIILSAGLIGLIVTYQHLLPSELNVLPLIISMGMVVVVLMVFCFFNIDLLVPIVKRIPFVNYFRKHLKHLAVLRNYENKELWEAIIFAFLRYLTYTLQYYFLLKFYGIPVPFFIGLAGIATIFFVQASIPLPPVMGLLARGEIALFIWGFFSEDQVAILAATFTLFVINIAIPALLGMAFIVQANILKSLGYENGKD
ncbi:MAG: lysylphosphatidylglycerol synthase domain-containing protein [Bacteroidota bacterium]